jgi:hypothetical protein
LSETFALVYGVGGKPMIRKLPIILENIVNETAQAIFAQQKRIDSLARVVLDNGIALDCILAEWR